MANVEPAVQLDQIFNALDPVTRRAFQVWQQQLAIAVRGNGQNLNSAIGNLPQFTADATDVLRVLDIEHMATVRLVQNGGTVFAALTQSQAALRNLITTAGVTFATTAANNNALADTFHVLPTFLNETKATFARLKVFALDTDPLIKELVPVAQQLTPTLSAVRILSPDLERLFVELGPLTTASETGFPALAEVLRGAEPLLASVDPFLEQLNPILSWLSLHQQLISDFISVGAVGLAAKTTAYGGSGLTCAGVPCGHYLRQFSPIGPQTTGLAGRRDVNSRGNTYPPSLWLADPSSFSAGGRFPGSFALPSWDCKPTGAAGNGSRPATATTRHVGSRRRCRAPSRARSRTSCPRTIRTSNARARTGARGRGDRAPRLAQPVADRRGGVPRPRPAPVPAHARVHDRRVRRDAGRRHACRARAG